MARSSSVGDRQIVVFQLAGEEYGVDIHFVREIIRLTEVTPVPKAPLSVSGVINLRGKIIPVIDGHQRFGLERTPVTTSSRIIVLEVAGEVVGLKVDAATEVLHLSSSQIEKAPDLALTESVKEAINAVAKCNERLIILLNPEKILPSVELQQAVAIGGEERIADEG
jgi:purine-binding chemotaxis protein CheW